MRLKNKKKPKQSVLGDYGDLDTPMSGISCMGDDLTDAEAQALNEVMGIFSPNEDFDHARSLANSDLIVLLADYLTMNPSLRFGQALHNLDLLSDVPTVEPQVQLNRAKKALKALRRK